MVLEVTHQPVKKSRICRDFVRNTCSRGQSCKYFHPERYVFCWDYQKGKCNRPECAFIHCSREDEEHYHQTGQLPPHLWNRPQVKSERILSKIELPQPTIAELFQPNNKRRRCELEEFVVHGETWSLADENIFLRNLIESLKTKVDHLQATNEFLLEQNAQMRLGDKSGLTAVTVPAVTITNAPQTLRTVTASVATVPVSIAAVAGTPVSIATVSMAPVQIPTPSVTMAHHQEQTTVSQAILSTTGPLVSYPIVTRSVMQNLTR